MTDIFAALQAVSASAESWETAKGVMLTISTAAVMWTARMVFKLRDDTRDLKRDIGTGGKNGLKKKVAEMQDGIRHIEERLDSIEDRNTRIDAVAEAERQQYEGPERRFAARRLRDSLIPDIPPVNPDKE